MSDIIYQVTPPREITLKELERAFEELNRHLQEISVRIKEIEDSL